MSNQTIRWTFRTSDATYRPTKATVPTYGEPLRIERWEASEQHRYVYTLYGGNKLGGDFKSLKEAQEAAERYVAFVKSKTPHVATACGGCLVIKVGNEWSRPFWPTTTFAQNLTTKEGRSFVYFTPYACSCAEFQPGLYELTKVG